MLMIGKIIQIMKDIRKMILQLSIFGSVLETLVMKIVQNYYFLLLVIHKFQSLDLKIFKEVVKFNHSKLKKLAIKKIYQKVIHVLIALIYLLTLHLLK
eukprot:jgi/Orpsp1_1/1175200/evm.model.c7180000052990.1